MVLEGELFFFRSSIAKKSRRKPGIKAITARFQGRIARFLQASIQQCADPSFRNDKALSDWSGETLCVPNKVSRGFTDCLATIPRRPEGRRMEKVVAYEARGGLPFLDGLHRKKPCTMMMCGTPALLPSQTLALRSNKAHACVLSATIRETSLSFCILV